MAAACALASWRAGAIEISLEQNRSEHSSIGFVDMHRLFEAFPETQRAKESFQEVVSKTQEQLNQQKAQILRLQNSLADLKAQRQALMEGQQAPPQPPAAPPAVSSAPALAAAPAVLSSTAAAMSTAPLEVAASSAPAVAASSAAAQGFAAQASSAAVFPELPGVPSATIARSPAPAPAAIAVSSPAAPSLPAVSSAAVSAAAPAAPQPLPVSQLSQDVRQKLAALDSHIAVTDQEINRDQVDYRNREAAAEKNLVDLEGNKTDILLGEIDKAIQTVADQEGISVVVDKGDILYGHDAVDLTDKVLKRLEESR
ncbi:MAG: OmpH family outer membrane protein [Elusimicrobia bacterium]|nr:OmpH family outer membrane protein [Elusimicrobiota bacterium]